MWSPKATFLSKLNARYLSRKTIRHCALTIVVALTLVVYLGVVGLVVSRNANPRCVLIRCDERGLIAVLGNFIDVFSCEHLYFLAQFRQVIQSLVI